MICNVRRFNHVVKMSRTRGRMYCTLHERKITRIAEKRFENKTLGIETKRRAARGTFLSPTRTLSLSPSASLYRSLLCLDRCHLRLILLLPSSRNHEECAKKQRSTEEGAFHARAIREREKRFQSKKGRSAPHIPPVVSAGLGATEPLRGSTIRGLSDAQCEDTPLLRRETTRSDEATNRSRNAIREAGRLLITGLFERDKVARINPTGWPAS